MDFFTFGTGSEGAFLYLCTGLHHFVSFHDDVKESLTQKRTIERWSKYLLPRNFSLLAIDLYWTMLRNYEEITALAITYEWSW